MHSSGKRYVPTVTRGFHFNGTNQELALRCHTETRRFIRCGLCHQLPCLDMQIFQRAGRYPFISPRTPNPPLMATKNTAVAHAVGVDVAIDLTVSLPKILIFGDCCFKMEIGMGSDPFQRHKGHTFPHANRNDRYGRPDADQSNRICAMDSCIGRIDQ